MGPGGPRWVQIGSKLVQMVLNMKRGAGSSSGVVRTPGGSSRRIARELNQHDEEIRCKAPNPSASSGRHVARGVTRKRKRHIETRCKALNPAAWSGRQVARGVTTELNRHDEEIGCKALNPSTSSGRQVARGVTPELNRHDEEIRCKALNPSAASGRQVARGQRRTRKWKRNREATRCRRTHPKH
jgi:hypothetical protein